MFRSRLNELLCAIGANDKAVAECAGFDRSNISHLRNGQKTPSLESGLTRRLVHGICFYAESTGRLPELCALTGADPAADPDTLSRSVSAWLLDVPDIPRSSRTLTGKGSQLSPTFSARLSRSMELAGLTNVRLAQLLYVDASLISRYRRGTRTPDPESSTAFSLSSILFSRIQKTDRTVELAGMMKSQEINAAAYHDWLFDQSVLPSQNAREIETLLESFSRVSNNVQKTAPPPADRACMDWSLPLPCSSCDSCETQDASDSSPSVYFGISGIRDAVIRFLNNALHFKATELLLYSDEPLDWMTAVPEFFQTWGSLMQACVRAGIRIRIIHNIDRNLGEMRHAIRGWTPLYLSGMVESFYLVKHRSSHFFHTLFLSPGKEGVAAFHVAGSSADGIYHYYTDAESIGILMKEYHTLLSSTEPLLEAGSTPFYKGEKDLIVIQNTLSIATMPKELAESFGSERLTAFWQQAQEQYFLQLKIHSVTECIPVASEEDLLKGTVMTEAFEGMAGIPYTAEQYVLHLRHIVNLEKEHPAYRFRKSPDTPFPEMKLLLAADCAKIIPADRPGFSLSFRHPLMCRAFLHYARELMKII